MQSLVGLSVFLFGSILLILLMLAISTMPSYNGLNPLYAVYISTIVIGVGLFVMLRTIGLLKNQNIVNVPRALIAVVVIGLGLLTFAWYFSPLYYSNFLYGFFGVQGCPSDGICWAELQMPVASIILSDIGAIFLQTSRKKGEYVDTRATLPKIQ